MVNYIIQNNSVIIERLPVIIDTNVLVAAFLESDQNHEQALIYLEICPNPIYVPVPVIIETWGMLVKARQSRIAGIKFMYWLLDSSKVTLIPGTCDKISDISSIVDKLEVDSVDAFILTMADDISVQCNLNPPVMIATFDTSDFLRFLSTRVYKFKLFDMRTLEEVDL